MTDSDRLQLGDTANLLYGFRPVWDRNIAAGSPFFSPTEPAVRPVTTPIPAQAPATWGWPVVTLHHDVTSLVDTLYDYRVIVPGSDSSTQASAAVPSGALVLDDADRTASLAALGALLGVDLTPQRRYALVRLRRLAGTVAHDAVARHGDRNRHEYLTREALAGLAKLPVQQDGPAGVAHLSPQQAQKYIDAYYQYGTHFVSAVDYGDVILQVFAYEPDAFTLMRQGMGNRDNVDGLDALEMRYYTRPLTRQGEEIYGFVRQYGHVLSLAGDPALTASVAAAGAWNDARYSVACSVFAPFRDTKDAPRLTAFTAVAPIGLEFTQVSELLPNGTERGRADRARIWDRMLRGALLQKYRDGVALAMPRESDTDWSTIYPQGDWLSTIASPRMDVYQERVDLGAVRWANPDTAETFSVFAHVLEARGDKPIDVPGTKVRLLASLVDASAGGSATSVPVLRMKRDAYDSFVLSCGRMHGALCLQSTDGGGHAVVVDGFRFATGDVDPNVGRTRVAVANGVFARPDLKILAGFATSMQFSLAAAESLLYSRGTHSEKDRARGRDHLEWLASLVPADCGGTELLAVRTQALYLSRVARNLQTRGMPVPYLTFTSYQDYVGSMLDVARECRDTIKDHQDQIRARRQAELTAKTAEQINANIKETGKLLTGYVSALAKNQAEVSAYYGSIVAERRKEYEAGIADLKTLTKRLNEQQDVVNAAVAKFQDQMQDWQKNQIASTVVDVATGVFSLAAGAIKPDGLSETAGRLARVAAKIQRVATVLGALRALEKTVVDQVKTLRTVADILDRTTELQMPTQGDWDEFKVTMTAALAALPPELAGPKADLSAAFEILVLRGKAWLTTRAQQAQILQDIYVNERQREINDEQARRIGELTGALHLNEVTVPEVSKIDLVGLSGAVQFQLKQVLAKLARVLVLQDAAVQFEYLGRPTEITTFDLPHLLTVMEAQQKNILDAVTRLDPPPHPVDEPIEYIVHGVPVGELTDGGEFEFPITASAPQFFRYAMVRVDRVVAKVVGVTGSDSGEYYVELTFPGEAFYDRDARRNPLVFTTVERHFGPFAYEIATGRPTFGDQQGTIQDKITKITPFGTWRISLPPTQLNQGLTFAGPTVDVMLTFNVTALLKDPSNDTFGPAMAVASDEAAAAQPLVTTSTGTGDMVARMNRHGATTNGWDAVLNLAEQSVNDFLKKQHEARHPSDTPMAVGVGVFNQVIPDPGGSDKNVASYTKFDVTLGEPLMRFEANNNSFVQVTQAILSGGVQTGSKYVPQDWAEPTGDARFDVSDPGIHWRPRKDVDLSLKPTVQGTVALAQVQGLVPPAENGSTTRSVILDFTKGSFSLSNMHVQTNVAPLNEALANWYTTHDVRYEVNTIDFSGLSPLESLIPSRFQFAVLTIPGETSTTAKNILQVFITTNGTDGHGLSLNEVVDPLPDSYQCSLIIKTKTMFQDVFVHGFNKGRTNFVVAGVDPGSDDRAWAAKVTSGTVSATVDLPSRRRIDLRIDSSGNTVNWDLSGLEFSGATSGLGLSYKVTRNQHYQWRRWIGSETAGTGLWPGEWQDASVNVTADMTGDYGLSVTDDTGHGQEIKIQDAADPVINVGNTSLKPTGACGCNDNDIKLQVLHQLQQKLPAAIRNQVGQVTFTPVTIFALENLLFPAKDVIRFDDVYVPGDLLVLGKFVNQTS